MYDSAASCRASKAAGWNLKPGENFWQISRTRRWKANFPINSSVLLWYLRISRKASVPGRYLRIFFIGRVVLGRAVILSGEIGSGDVSSTPFPFFLDNTKVLGTNWQFIPILCLSIVCFILTMFRQGNLSSLRKKKKNCIRKFVLYGPVFLKTYYTKIRPFFTHGQDRNRLLVEIYTLWIYIVNKRSRVRLVTRLQSYRVTTS